MVIDVIDVSEITNVKVQKAPRDEKKSEKAKKPPKSTNVKKQNTPQKKVQVAVKDDKNLEKIPSKKVEKKKPEPKPKPKKNEVKEEKKDEPKEKKESFEKAILKSIEEETKKIEDQKIDKKFADLTDALRGESNKEYNENIPMSMSEIDAIKSQITRNWNTTSFSGANSMGMEVVVNIVLDMDGNVLSAQALQENDSSPYYRAFVDSAVRAVKAASPLKDLKKEKFASWKEIEFRFDSSGMIY